jgi:hypothetical protein
MMRVRRSFMSILSIFVLEIFCVWNVYLKLSEKTD